MNVQDLVDALSGAYDRGYAQGKADALAAQPAPVPEEVAILLRMYMDSHGPLYALEDEYNIASAWLDSQRTDADGSDCDENAP